MRLAYVDTSCLVALALLVLLEETARAVAAAIASPDPLRLAHLPGSPQRPPAKRSVSHGPPAPSGMGPPTTSVPPFSVRTFSASPSTCPSP